MFFSCWCYSLARTDANGEKTFKSKRQDREYSKLYHKVRKQKHLLGWCDEDAKDLGLQRSIFSKKRHFLRRVSEEYKTIKTISHIATRGHTKLRGKKYIYIFNFMMAMLYTISFTPHMPSATCLARRKVCTRTTRANVCQIQEDVINHMLYMFVVLLPSVPFWILVALQ